MIRRNGILSIATFREGFCNGDIVGAFFFCVSLLIRSTNGLGLQQSLIFGLLLFDIVGIQAIKLRLDKGPKSTICGFIK